MNASKKLFALITSNFSIEEFKELKKHANCVFSDELNRPLKPSSLDTIVSRLFGAHTPNTMSASLKPVSVEKSFDMLTQGYKDMLSGSESDTCRILRMYPLAKIMVSDRYVKDLPLYVYADLSLIDGELCSDLFINTHAEYDNGDECESPLYEALEAGGLNLAERFKYTLGGYNGGDVKFAQELADLDIRIQSAMLTRFSEEFLCVNPKFFGSLVNPDNLWQAIKMCNHNLFWETYRSLGRKGARFVSLDICDESSLKAR